MSLGYFAPSRSCAYLVSSSSSRTFSFGGNSTLGRGLLVPGKNCFSTQQEGSVMSEPKVEHQPNKSRFALTFPDGDVAVLDYQEIRPGVLDFYHTETPPSKRGRGIAAKVTTAAFEYLKENDYKAIPSCWYVKDNFLSENPQYRQYVVKK